MLKALGGSRSVYSIEEKGTPRTGITRELKTVLLQLLSLVQNQFYMHVKHKPYSIISFFLHEITQNIYCYQCSKAYFCTYGGASICK